MSRKIQSTWWLERGLSQDYNTVWDVLLTCIVTRFAGTKTNLTVNGVCMINRRSYS